MYQPKKTWCGYFQDKTRGCWTKPVGVIFSNPVGVIFFGGSIQGPSQRQNFVGVIFLVYPFRVRDEICPGSIRGTEALWVLFSLVVWVDPSRVHPRDETTLWVCYFLWWIHPGSTTVLQCVCLLLKFILWACTISFSY